MFDLDGTLLPMDLNFFLKQYFQKLTAKLAPFANPKEILNHIMASTQAMIKNNSSEKTNREIFWNVFSSRVNDSKKNLAGDSILLAEDLVPVFEDFYQKEFKELRKFTQPTPLAREIVQTLSRRGYEIALATNPIFPREAIVERMRWAGVDDMPWAIVTSYENSHFCKPNLNYFAEIMQKLRRNPAECMMVGNDPREDLIAGSLGIKTYLVTDNCIERDDIHYKPDFKGTLEDLAAYIKTLPDLNTSNNIYNKNY